MTDENGIFRSGRIKPNTYLVRELNPSPGYAISDKTSPDRVIVAKAGDGEIIVKVDNIKLPEIVITKQDKITKKPISNVTYKFVRTEDGTEGFYTTDANGEIKLILPEGIYTISEYAVPNNIILDTEQHIDIALENGKIKPVLFENIRKPTLVITKISGLDYLPVPNTTIAIRYEMPNGGVEALGNFRTNKDGKIILPNQRVGWYQIEEKIPAPGMNLPSNPISRVYLNPGENSYSLEELGEGNNGNGGNGQNGDIKFQSGYDYLEDGHLVVNYPKNSIVVKKSCAITGKMLGDATFELYKVTGEISGSGGTLISTFTADSSGVCVITGVDAGAGYIIKEVTPPPFYTLSETNQQQVWLKADATSICEVNFRNHPYGGILVNKVSWNKNAASENHPIANVKFSVTDASGKVLGNENGIFYTDADGQFLVTGIEPGTSVVVTELDPGPLWVKNDTPQTVLIGNDGTTHKLTFKNKPYGTLVLNKYNLDGEPLADCEFLVKYSDGQLVGNSNGIYRTDPTGTVTIPGVYGSIVVEETKAPPNYTISAQNTQTIFIDYGETKSLNFYNALEGFLTVTKYGVEGTDLTSKILLSNCKFIVEKQSGERVGTYTTTDGFFTIPYLEPGNYICYEIETASSDYLLDSTPQSFTITADGKPVNLTFYNHKKSGLEVRKYGLVGNEKIPLDDCNFKVIRKNGEEVGTFTTKNGFFLVDNLIPGWYSCYEVSAKTGFLLDPTPQDFEITNNSKLVKLEFVNKKLGGLLVHKYGIVDGERKPLGGITFRVVTNAQEVIGEYTTSEIDGTFAIPELAPGYYSCYEISTGSTGFALDPTPQHFEIKADGGEPVTLYFENHLKASIHLKKISSIDRSPIEGISFTLSKLNGERIGGEYKTSKTGEIFFAGLEQGTYILQEVKNDGYIPDTELRYIEVVTGETKYEEWENTPISGLLLYKTSERDNRPLAGVIFEIRKSNGELVGNEFITDEKGRIYVDLPAGDYHITEKQGLKGFEKDDTIHKITVRPGQQEILRVTNKELAGLRIIKVDSLSKKPIMGVEFRIYDEITGVEIAGPFFSDSNGVVDFSGVISEGRYRILETKQKSGYLPDNVARTVEFKAGVYTEIIWTNQPEQGQIRVKKTAAADNEQNGISQGEPLAGAVFELLDYDTRNVICQFESGPDGYAVSPPVPLGDYLLREIKAPKYYQINTKEEFIKIRHVNEIVELSFTNLPANTGVYIKKVGNLEAIAGQTIKYDFKAIENVANVPLTDFFYRDIIPVDALRINKIVTGSFNQSLKYKIMYKTNKNSDYMVLADNLQTTRNNVIDCRPANFGLYSDEHITEVMFVFGAVKAGFCQVEEPSIYFDVLNGLPNGYQFANRADCGGVHNAEWIISNSTFLTTIYSKNQKMPKTGH